MILDPGSATEFVIRRPAIEAIAQELPWTPSYDDAAVRASFGSALDGFEEFSGWSIAAGDPSSRLESAEVELTLSLARSFTQVEFAELMQKVASKISESEVIALKVDSLRVKLATA
jgi:hypothetical protein